ncbi:MAG: hypothetical protein LBQ54_01700, partial [Planctomycetaceae bacterium]|nr:hypothetical protein [Planctomycetaceae bacterium]
MFRPVLTTLLAFIVGVVSAAAQEKKIPASLDEAKTVAEVTVYTTHTAITIQSKKAENIEDYIKNLR